MVGAVGVMGTHVCAFMVQGHTATQAVTCLLRVVHARDYTVVHKESKDTRWIHNEPQLPSRCAVRMTRGDAHHGPCLLDTGVHLACVGICMVDSYLW